LSPSVNTIFADLTAAGESAEVLLQTHVPSTEPLTAKQKALLAVFAEGHKPREEAEVLPPTSSTRIPSTELTEGMGKHFLMYPS
jgi:hypothetical protein